MSYELQAFIGAMPIFSEIESPRAKVVPLPQGMALVPLLGPLSLRGFSPERPAGGQRAHAGFESLSEPLYQLGLKLSERGPVAYVEAFFFGNAGGQDAIVWEHGTVVMEPKHSYNGLACSPDEAPRRALAGAAPCFPINEALRRLGVTKAGEHDEFDALNLGRHRKTERWAE